MVESDGNSQLNNIPSSRPPSPILFMSVGEEIGATTEPTFVRLDQSGTGQSVDATDLNCSESLALSTLEGAASDDSMSASSHGSIKISNTTGPRVLDLHKCPLLIAEAAIDYEMKQIYDECVSEGSIVSANGYSVSARMSTESCAEHNSSSDSNCFDEGDLIVQPSNHLSPRRSSRHNRRKTLDEFPTVSPTSPPPIDDIPLVTLIQSAKPKTCAFDLHIVTGRGKHINSSGTRGVLRFNIKDYLLDTYDIVAERISGNDGCIIVTSSSINRWIARMQSLTEKAP